MDGKDFSVSRGDLICTAFSSYLVEEFVGEGTFGKVARCVKTATNEKVAVKIIKNHPALIASAKQEIAMLKRLRVLDPDGCGIVRWMGVFKHGPQICLEFELLDKCLRDLTRQTELHILPLMQIKIILEQLATALDYLGTIGIIHADLKPENIMLTGQDTKVKLIDFGISCHVSQAKIGIDIQTLWYRSPEIMLGLPFTGLIDMWSLGCVAAELLIGFPIYPGYTEYDMWRYILETHGDLPDAMLDHGIKTLLCFTKGSFWRLKSPQEYEERERLKPRRTRQFRFSSLEEVVQAGTVPGQSIPPSFTDLMKRMLQLDANRRITPRALLEHPFISLERGVQPNSCCPEPGLDRPNSCCPEPGLDRPNSSSSECSVDQPKSCCTERSVDHHNSGSSLEKEIKLSPPVSHTPSVSEDQEATVDTTDSGKGTSSDLYASTLQNWLDDKLNSPLAFQMFSLEKETNMSPPVSHTPSVSEDQTVMVDTTYSGKGTSSDASTLQNWLDDLITSPLASEMFSVDQPNSCYPERSLDQPNSSCTERTVDHHNSGSSLENKIKLSPPVNHTPSVSENQMVMVDITYSGKGTSSDASTLQNWLDDKLNLPLAFQMFR
ncbi:unnamed protein product [Lota lota]